MLKVRQYQELHEGKCESLFYEMIHFVSVVNDLNPLEVEEWDSFKLVTEFDKVKNLTKIPTKLTKQIQVNDVKLNLVSFERLTLGQFIDLETYVNDDYFNNLHKIASIIYLRLEGGGLNEVVAEPYENINIDYRANLIKELPAVQVIPACNTYLDFRKNFFNSYDLFDDPFSDVNEAEMDEEEKAIYLEEKKEFENKGGNQWADILNLLSKEDITKFEHILKTNLFMAFNQVSWLKSNKK